MTAKTIAERQAAYKARKAAIGHREVRGIQAYVDDHKAIKAAAAKIGRRRVRAEKKGQR